VTDLLARTPEAARDGAPAKQILFGDLHVHTTFSVDAFNRTLPLLQGEGAHPPADACDFARFCSDLDFWSINDHAEGLTPRHWEETKESIRQCNALAGDPGDPDAVAFLGWEWSQMGLTPEDHYGHKNVIFRELEDDRVPIRPISARGVVAGGGLRPLPLWRRLEFPLLDFANRQRYYDFGLFMREIRDVPICPEGIDTRELPPDCHELALTPAVLFEKLAQWGFDAIVIPHGTTWGFYTPAGSTLDKQLAVGQHDPEKQTLFEIYSGHGNSEEYRDWRDLAYDAAGAPQCPEPTPEYLPCCWQAGEIIRSRCEDPRSEECARRVADARRNFVEAGVPGHLTVPGATVEQWKDCDLCRDCFNPAFRYRPGNSAQYALAIASFDGAAEPRRFRFGFIGSSDNHTARPGTGYKDYARRMMTEAIGARDAAWARRINPPEPPPGPASIPISELGPIGFAQYVHMERQASFFMTGGIVGAHSAGRGRDSIWQTLKRREVYATSGDRILLWFDLLNGPDGPLPMGGETALGEAPRFRVRAVGALEQKPGCPGYSLEALGPERLEYLCRGECYNPGDERRLITRIEVIRILRQQRPGEPVAQRIEDPWRRFECPPDPAGCAFEVEDAQFPLEGREIAYYARAVQEPTPAINAGGVRCEYDESGRCVRTRPCYGDFRTPFDDDCLSPNEERAWSSPIYVIPAAPGEG
jgi:hypothetical protein